MSKKGSSKPLASYMKEKMVQCNKLEDAIFNIKVILKYIDDNKLDINIDEAYSLLEDNQNLEQSIGLIIKYKCEGKFDNNINIFITAYNLKFNLEEESIQELDDLGVTNDIITDYIRNLNHKLLTREEEIELGKRKDNGDNKARNQLVEHNLRWVVCIAKRYKTSDGEFIDLIQEGNIGLIKAANKYDYKKGYRFSTYAKCWIEQTIILYLKKLSKVIRIPNHITEKAVLINEYIENYIKQNNCKPTLEELSNIFPKSKKSTIIECLNSYSCCISLNEIVNNIINDSDVELEFFIENPRDYLEEWINKEFFEEFITKIASSIVLSVAAKQKILNNLFQGRVPPEKEWTKKQKAAYNYAIASQNVLILSEQEFKILELTFGLNGLNPMTRKEIGKLYGISQQRISQILKKILYKLSINHDVKEFYYGFFDVEPSVKKFTRKK